MDRMHIPGWDGPKRDRCSPPAQVEEHDDRMHIPDWDSAERDLPSQLAESKKRIDQMHIPDRDSAGERAEKAKDEERAAEWDVPQNGDWNRG
jgi:hypothetical protein